MDPVDRHRLRRSFWSPMCGPKARAITAARLDWKVAGHWPLRPAGPAKRGAQRLCRVLEDGVGTGPARAVAARRVSKPSSTTMRCSWPPQARQCRPAWVGHPSTATAQGKHAAGGGHLVVAVPVAPLAQQRGGLLPRRMLEVRRRRTSERLVDRRFEELLPAAEDALVDAAVVAPSGQRLRGRHQLLVHARPPPQQVPHRPLSASWASSAAAEYDSSRARSWAAS